MFKMTIKDVFNIPQRGAVLVGVDVEGIAKIGDFLTDGVNRYEITGIPTHCGGIRNLDEIDLLVSAGEPNALIGKTLVAA